MQNNKFVADGFQSAHIIIMILDMDSSFSLATSKSAANGYILSSRYLNLFKSKTTRRLAQSGPVDIIVGVNSAFVESIKSAALVLVSSR